MTNPINFTNLDELIRSPRNKITLDSDVVMSAEEAANFKEGIQINTDKLIIDAKGHIIDAGGNSRIFEVIAGEITLLNMTVTGTPAEAVINRDRLKIIDSNISNQIINDKNAVLKVENSTVSQITNDATLILIAARPDSVVNNSLLYLPEGEMQDNVSGAGEIIEFRRLLETENSFSDLKRLIDKYGEGFKKNFRHLIYNDDNEEFSKRLNHVIWGNKDNLIRFKGDVILDIYNDECFTFPKGFEIDVDGIIIDGRGYAVDCKGFSRLFTVTSKDVTIQNLTLKNGYANVGGALRNAGGKVKLSSVTVENCSAIKNGGAIYNEGGKIAIKRVFFNSNWAGNGGAIYNDGEIIIDYANFQNNLDITIFNIGKLIINDSRFVNKSTIENNGILKIWNNSFDDADISNHSQSLLKIFNKKPRKNAVIHYSTQLRVTNHGSLKAYGFKDKIIPACTITGNGRIQYDSRDDYLKDVVEHNKMVKVKSKNLIGKKTELRFLDENFHRHSNNILLIRGEEGIGKNTLLCMWHETLKKADHKSIIRLCETTSKSSTFKDLYLSVGSEAGILNGDEEDIIKSSFEFDEEFFKGLIDKGIEVLTISNIDRLDEFNLGTVPEEFYLVLSSGFGFELENPHYTVELGGLATSEERYEIINRYLEGNIDNTQKEHLESNFASESPLFIEIILNEIKHSRSYDNLESEIQSFGDSTYTAFSRLVEILENDKAYPRDFAKHALSLLAYSGNGLDKNALLMGLEYSQDQDEYLKSFLDRVEKYILEKNNRYIIGYEEFRKAIIDRFSNADESRRKLVEIYRKSMMNATADMKYSDIIGSDDILNQLELLGDYDGLLEIFKDDALLDKVLPSEYGLIYKNGTFYFKNEDILASNLENYKKTDVLSKISMILLDKANRIYLHAKNTYESSESNSRDFEPEEFARYKDSFYEPPVYFNASAFYAERYLEMETDSAKRRRFINGFDADSTDLINFFKSMSQTGSEDLALSHQVEDLMSDALFSKRRLDEFIKNLPAK